MAAICSGKGGGRKYSWFQWMKMWHSTAFYMTENKCISTWHFTGKHIKHKILHCWHKCVFHHTLGILTLICTLQPDNNIHGQCVAVFYGSVETNLPIVDRLIPWYGGNHMIESMSTSLPWRVKWIVSMNPPGIQVYATQIILKPCKYVWGYSTYFRCISSKRLIVALGNVTESAIGPCTY